MSIFYTSARNIKGNIYVRGYDNGEYFSTKVNYSPTVYLPTNNSEESEWRDYHGNFLKPMKFQSISMMRNYVGDGSQIFGFTRSTEQEYAFINEFIPDEVVYDKKYIKVAFLDIEIESEGRMPNSWVDASNIINAITVAINDGIFHTWGLGKYTGTMQNLDYREFDNEGMMLYDFCKFMRKEKCDAVSSWNGNSFDLPYIFNRIIQKYNRRWTTYFSPWGLYPEEREQGLSHFYIIPGLADLDYMKLYKRFILTPRESYSLNNIAYVEIGEKKLDYSEFASLADLYKKSWNTFIDYNIRDVDLLRKLDKKLQLLAITYRYAYMAKANFEDVFGTAKYLDILIYNYLYKQKIAVPPKKYTETDDKYAGGFVKAPYVGMSKWIASADVDSLYPSIIVQFNISPETILDIPPFTLHSKDELVESIAHKTFDNKYVKNSDIIMTASGYYYSRTKQGFLPALVEEKYAQRKKIKIEMLKKKREIEVMKKELKVSHDPELEKKIELLDYEVQDLNTQQNSLKIFLNAIYGGLGAGHFRYFDVRLAETVTLTGQATIKWTERITNEYLNNLLNTKEVDYVIAIDTDSVYVTLKKLVEELFPVLPETKKVIKAIDRFANEKLLKVMNDSYVEYSDYLNAYKNAIHIKLESIGDTAIWLKKKKYVINVYSDEGVIYNEPKLKVKNLEIIRSSTPEICRVAIKEAVTLIMNKDEVAVQQFIYEFKKKFFQSSPTDIAFPRSCKDIEKWIDGEGCKKSTPIHVRAAITYNNYLKKINLSHKYEEIKSGNKLKFVYMRMPNVLHEHVIAFPQFLPKDFELDDEVDLETQFQKTFINPVKMILDVIGWQIKKKSTLAGIFKSV